MKWLVSLLALVNLAMLGWILFASGHSQPVDRTAIYNHSIRPEMRLRLLSEVDKLDYLPEEPPAQDKPPVVVAESGPQQPTTEVPQPTDKQQAENQLSDEEPPATPNSASDNEDLVTGPPPPPVAIAQPAETKKPPAADFVTPHCFTLGPFAKKQTASEVSENLASLGLHTTNRETSQRQSVGYWVYLPPFGSREQARNMEKLLARKGVKDFLIIPSGVMENAISLGVFSRRSTANRRVDELRDSGINALVKQNFDVTVLYWLDFSSPDEAPLPADTLAKLQQKQDGIGLIKHSCE